MGIIQRFRTLVQNFDIITTHRGSVWRDSSTNGNLGNQYTSPQEQVSQLVDMFDNRSDWGGFLVNTIVHLRAAFTLGSGIKVIYRDGAEREKQFIQNYMRINKLDNFGFTSFAREAELEGRFLQVLKPVEDERNFKSIHIPWSCTHYTVETDSMDYTDIKRVWWESTDPGSNSRKTYPANKFTYAKFNGRIASVNDFGPRLGGIIGEMVGLHKCIKDWRNMNHLMATPTPHIKCENQADVSTVEAALTGANWSLGKLLVTGNADFSMVGLQRGGPNSLEAEYQTLAKIISMVANLPVHFLGLPELMSNRSTADNSMEVVDAGTQSERKVWKWYFTEHFRDAMLLSNETYKTALDPDKIEVEVPFITASRFAEIVNIWLPMYVAGTITLDTLLSKVPEIPDDEADSVEDEQKRKMDEMMAREESFASGESDNDDQE